MFTGIITDLGKVRERKPGAVTRLVIETQYDTAGIALGASIACNGCCLSVVEKGPGWFAFEASNETLDVTTLGGWQVGTRVNLERALRLGDELGGHLVSGHVDGVGRIKSVRPDGGSVRLTVSAPKALARFIASKGSIAMDGVSLTVNEVAGVDFGVNIIPITLEATNLGAAHEGDRVNLEIDMMARYLARLTEKEPA
ncbi:riboflavin synthase subunit alpha [Hypericibacter adhaerens]|jgi:riboflavin synthase|uniref:Riboflavin synthase n=1 Tax=Hypericibacter adhaerens TaxID=2602016 RepID=A0A5J6MYC7_9PROT|nr:riboflavin synthase [Hypericibacter adhaerens]QEX22718.1 riboflavin synthase subunit alpha [Hypericibacter adhaerens]